MRKKNQKGEKRKDKEEPNISIPTLVKSMGEEKERSLSENFSFLQKEI